MMAEMLKRFDLAWQESLDGHFSKENDELIRSLALQIDEAIIPKFIQIKFPAVVERANAFASFVRN